MRENVLDYAKTAKEFERNRRSRAAPDQTTWLGRRDHTLLLVAAQTGLRLSELIGLDRNAVHLRDGAHVV